MTPAVKAIKEPAHNEGAEGPRIARLGDKFEPSEKWRCGVCGTVHAFNDYAAAHWEEPLEHRCERCDTARVFLDGAVISSFVPPAPNIRSIKDATPGNQEDPE